jgi:hypothetical protein
MNSGAPSIAIQFEIDDNVLDTTDAQVAAKAALTSASLRRHAAAIRSSMGIGRRIGCTPSETAMHPITGMRTVREDGTEIGTLRISNTGPGPTDMRLSSYLKEDGRHMASDVNMQSTILGPTREPDTAKLLEWAGWIDAVAEALDHPLRAAACAATSRRLKALKPICSALMDDGLPVRLIAALPGETDPTIWRGMERLEPDHPTPTSIRSYCSDVPWIPMLSVSHRTDVESLDGTDDADVEREMIRIRPIVLFPTPTGDPVATMRILVQAGRNPA